MARPTKLIPETQTTIVDAILHGATYADASEAAGVRYETFNNWMLAGQAARSGAFFEFFNAVKRAEAECRVMFTRVIQTAAAKGDWRAAEAYLKRRDRANWGDSMDVTSGGDAIRQPQIIEIVRPAEEKPAETNNDADRV